MAGIKNLTVGYGETAILRNLSLDFPAGSITCLTGRSGCGKTTLLLALSGLLRPISGDISGITRAAVVFQENRLLPYLSAVKNIVVMAGCTETQAADALKSMDFLPEDLEKAASSLSGGMARRVSIARAMLAPGDCVLMDEPFKGLDETTRARVLEFVLEHRHDRTMIVVTHDARDAADLNHAHTIEMT